MRSKFRQACRLKKKAFIRLTSFVSALILVLASALPNLAFASAPDWDLGEGWTANPDGSLTFQGASDLTSTAMYTGLNTEQKNWSRYEVTAKVTTAAPTGNQYAGWGMLTTWKDAENFTYLRHIEINNLQQIEMVNGAEAGAINIHGCDYSGSHTYDVRMVVDKTAGTIQMYLDGTPYALTYKPENTSTDTVIAFRAIGCGELTVSDIAFRQLVWDLGEGWTEDEDGTLTFAGDGTFDGTARYIGLTEEQKAWNVYEVTATVETSELFEGDNQDYHGWGMLTTYQGSGDYTMLRHLQNGLTQHISYRGGSEKGLVGGGSAADDAQTGNQTYEVRLVVDKVNRHIEMYRNGKQVFNFDCPPDEALGDNWPADFSPETVVGFVGIGCHTMKVRNVQFHQIAWDLGEGWEADGYDSLTFRGASDLTSTAVYNGLNEEQKNWNRYEITAKVTTAAPTGNQYAGWGMLTTWKDAENFTYLRHIEINNLQQIEMVNGAEAGAINIHGCDYSGSHTYDVRMVVDKTAGTIQMYLDGTPYALTYKPENTSTDTVIAFRAIGCGELTVSDIAFRQLTWELGEGWTENADGSLSYAGGVDSTARFDALTADQKAWKAYEFSGEITMDAVQGEWYTGWGPVSAYQAADAFSFFRVQTGGAVNHVDKPGNGLAGWAQGPSDPLEPGKTYAFRMVVDKTTRYAAFYLDGQLCQEGYFPDNAIWPADTEIETAIAFYGNSCGAFTLKNWSFRQLNWVGGDGWTDNGDGTFSFAGGQNSLLWYTGLSEGQKAWDYYEFTGRVQMLNPAVDWTGWGPVAVYADKDTYAYFRTQGNGSAILMANKNGKFDNEVEGWGFGPVPVPNPLSAFTFKLTVDKDTREIVYYVEGNEVLRGTFPEDDQLWAAGTEPATVLALQAISCGPLKVSDLSFTGVNREPLPSDWEYDGSWVDNGDGSFSTTGGNGMLQYTGLTDEEKAWDAYSFSGTVEIQSAVPEGAEAWAGWGPLTLNAGEGDFSFLRYAQGGIVYHMHYLDGQEQGTYGDFGGGKYKPGDVIRFRLEVNKLTRHVKLYINDELKGDQLYPENTLWPKDARPDTVIGLNLAGSGALTLRDISFEEIVIKESNWELGEGWTENEDGSLSVAAGSGSLVRYKALTDEQKALRQYQITGTVHMDSVFEDANWWRCWGPIVSYVDADNYAYVTYCENGQMFIKDSKTDAALPGDWAKGEEPKAGSEFRFRLVVDRDTRQIQYYVNDTLYLDQTFEPHEVLWPEGGDITPSLIFRAHSSGAFTLRDFTIGAVAEVPDAGDWVLGSGWSIDQATGDFVFAGGINGMLYNKALTDEQKAWEIYSVSGTVTMEALSNANWGGWGPVSIRKDDSNYAFFRSMQQGGTYHMEVVNGEPEQDIGWDQIASPQHVAGQSYTFRLVIDKTARTCMYYVNGNLGISTYYPDNDFPVGELWPEGETVESVFGFMGNSCGALRLSDFKLEEGAGLMPEGDWTLGDGWSVDGNTGDFVFAGGKDSLLYQNLTDEQKAWEKYAVSGTVSVEAISGHGWTGWGPVGVMQSDSQYAFFRTMEMGGTYLVDQGGTQVAGWDIGNGSPALAAGQSYTFKLVVDKAARTLTYYVNDAIVLPGAFPAGDLWPEGAGIDTAFAFRANSCGALRLSDFKLENLSQKWNLGNGWTENADGGADFVGGDVNGFLFLADTTAVGNADIYDLTIDVRINATRNDWTGFGPVLYYGDDSHYTFIRNMSQGSGYVMEYCPGEVPLNMVGTPAHAEGMDYKIRMVVNRRTRQIMLYVNDVLCNDFILAPTQNLPAEEPLPVIAGLYANSCYSITVRSMEIAPLDVMPGQEGDWLLGAGWTDNGDGTFSYSGNGGGSLIYNKLTDEQKAWRAYQVTAKVQIIEKGPAGWTGWGPIVIYKNSEWWAAFRTQDMGQGYLMEATGGADVDVGWGAFGSPEQVAGETFDIRMTVDKDERSIAYYVGGEQRTRGTYPETALLSANEELETVLGIKTFSSGPILVSELAVAEYDPDAEEENPNEVPPYSEEYEERWFAALDPREGEPEPEPLPPAPTNPATPEDPGYWDPGDYDPGDEPGYQPEQPENPDATTPPTEYVNTIVEEVVRRRKRKPTVTISYLPLIISLSSAGVVLAGAGVTMLILKKKTGRYLPFIKKKSTTPKGEE